jgi:hypothetical protein
MVFALQRSGTKIDHMAHNMSDRFAVGELSTKALTCFAQYLVVDKTLDVWATIETLPESVDCLSEVIDSKSTIACCHHCPTAQRNTRRVQQYSGLSAREFSHFVIA